MRQALRVLGCLELNSRSQLCSTRIVVLRTDRSEGRARGAESARNTAELRIVPRQNYDLPRNQSDRSVASFAFLSVSNWFHAAPAEASVRIVCPVLLLSSRFALGESGLAATTCYFEGETPAASLFHL
jgi:hypothetical protein